MEEGTNWVFSVGLGCDCLHHSCWQLRLFCLMLSLGGQHSNTHIRIDTHTRGGILASLMTPVGDGGPKPLGDTEGGWLFLSGAMYSMCTHTHTHISPNHLFLFKMLLLPRYVHTCTNTHPADTHSAASSVSTRRCCLMDRWQLSICLRKRRDGLREENTAKHTWPMCAKLCLIYGDVGATAH